MNDIKMTQHKHVFIAEFEFSHETKDIVKDCGFKFNRDTKDWYTDDLECANELATLIGDDNLRDSIFHQLQQKKWEDQQAYDMSDAKYPKDKLELESPDGLEYKPYQFAFLEWWKQRTTNGYRNLLEASEMGIGKTIETIMIMNIIKNPDPRYLIV